jgi:prevent-host-death family protein
MKTAAAEISDKLGQLLDGALTEPMVVEKHGRPSLVILPYQEYEQLRAVEDAYWGARAQAAELSGWVGSETALARIRSRLDAEA